MSDLRELYLEMVTDHAKNPRHRGKADPCDCIGNGNNPLCGDKIIVTLTLNDDTISNVKFDGEGCAISTASADLMAETLIGKKTSEAKKLFKTMSIYKPTASRKESKEIYIFCHNLEFSND